MHNARIRDNLFHVRDRLAESARRSGRDPGSVVLVAVTKKRPASWIRPLVEAGVRDLGENFPQELWEKAEVLADLPPEVRWHLIGHLQRNKVKRTLPIARVIHAVDSLRLLRAIDGRGAEGQEPPMVFLQVNTSDEEAKQGWRGDAILDDAEEIAGCRWIRPAGLMTMAAWGTDAESARPSFTRLREIRDALRDRSGLELPELSMGMSNDFEAAVEEGATLVRIGSALFEGVEP